MTHADLMTRMSFNEFMEWMALERVEPFGERAAYLRTGLIVSTMANIHRDDKTPAYRPSDFMPDFDDDDTPRKTPQQINDILTVIQKMQAQKAARQNG